MKPTQTEYAGIFDLRGDKAVTRILIVADNMLARAGLAALLAERSSSEVVGQVAGGETLADDVDVYRPEVLVWDLGWQPQTALERFGQLLDELGDGEALPVVALLPDESRAAEVAALLRTVRAGGVFLRDTDTAHLIAALPIVAQGLLVIDPALADRVLPDGETPPESISEALTPREQEVLQLLAEGLPNKTIARQLGISDHTVKFHVNAIMSKLDAQSRTGAVVKATRLGLIML